MDDNDLVKVGMEVALKPLTDIAENALGLLGGDWLSAKRERRRAKLREQTEGVLKERGAQMDRDPSPSIVVPLLSAAQDEDRESLAEMWARLTATALNPATRHTYRREFVEVARQLEPIDVLVLPFLAEQSDLMPSRRDFIAARIQETPDRVQLAFQNLDRLGLVMEGKHPMFPAHPYLSTLGREFLRAVS